MSTRGLMEQRLGDLDDLPPAERQSPDRRDPAARRADELRRSPRPAARGAGSRRGRAPRISAEADVFRDRKMRARLSSCCTTAMPGRRAPPGVRRSDRAPSTRICPAVGPQRARQQVDQCALARAILAEKGVDAPGDSSIETSRSTGLPKNAFETPRAARTAWSRHFAAR